ncbi:hypothetical protein P1X14_03210 [Sphingomonas sp. AOB5]|uniref:hypothetical protein n=1 Tax=Sphingomonas sp. AOB5 TaxID=3034017 RepID=UPI0023F8CAE4|nr:hypothetical protein [Sphingomonas sp. AOB5]MDF7774247.1 hypothetical protein [Sphingomonas sp. AOB5]
MRIAIGLMLAVSLSACGAKPAGDKRDDTFETKAAEVLSANGSNDCAKNPDFAPIYTDAKINVCSSAHFDATGKDAGTVSYSSAAAPAVILAWSKEHATKSGLAERISNDKMFSAGEGNKRTIMVMALPEGSGSKVTVNWGKAP